MLSYSWNSWLNRLNNWTPGGIYILLLCFFLLWPFDFHIPFLVEEISWLSEGNGVRIWSVSAIRSSTVPEKFYNRLQGGKGITIEVWVSPKDVTQTGPARIVSYSLDKSLRNFTLGQDGDTLVMRLRTTQTNLNGRNPELRVPELFIPKIPQHIVVTYDYVRERVYVNGREQFEMIGPGGNFANWDQSYQFLIGNEVTGNRPWMGEIFLVAVYNRALSAKEVEKNYHVGRVVSSEVEQEHRRVYAGLVALYSFIEGKGNMVFDQSGILPTVDLRFVSATTLTGQAFLGGRDQVIMGPFWLLFDIIGNIVIFFPLGFLLYFPLIIRTGSFRKAVVLSCVVGMAISLAVEMLQYFSLVRISSFTDVETNTIGMILGSLLANLIYVQFLRKVSGEKT